MDEPKKDKTVVGEIMKHGGGAAVGAATGAVASAPVIWGLGAALAPLTGGLSLGVATVIQLGMTVAGGVAGHKLSKKIDD